MADTPKVDPIVYLRSRRDELARTHGITSLRVFGSRPRGDARPDSDVDVIIEAEKPYRFDFLGLIALEQELSDDMGLPVDLILDEGLKPRIAARARDEAVPGELVWSTVRVTIPPLIPRLADLRRRVRASNAATPSDE